jgi:hypothetical protein
MASILVNKKGFTGNSPRTIHRATIHRAQFTTAQFTTGTIHHKNKKFR